MRPLTIVADSASELCHQVLAELATDLSDRRWMPVAPRGMPVRELRAATYQVTDAANRVAWLPGRRLNYPFMAAEFAWMYLGRSDVASISRYCREISKFSDDGAGFAGAYGPMISRQWGWAAGNLASDPDSRQAVISIWRPAPPASKDVPCTVACQFLVRGGKVESVFTMRSSDAWLGLPYDVHNFCALTAAMAGELGLQARSMTLNVGSSHLYERDLAKAAAVLGAIDGDGLSRTEPGAGIVSGPLPRPEPGAGVAYLNHELEGRHHHGHNYGGGWAELVSAFRHASDKGYAMYGALGEAASRG